MKDRKRELSAEEKAVQKTLSKLISEETVAHDFYIACVMAACRCQSEIISKLFIEIAEDELDDHAKHLVEFARANEYEVPFSYKQYERYAGSCVDQLNKLKTLQDAKYYVAEAIKSEEDAIKSYEEAMADNSIPYELNAILLQNYYDEQEHYDKLTTLMYALGAGAQLQLKM